ncbi:MAG: hypothetical protein QHG99_01595 [Methanomicrobiales archaeon]|nr:hypothetical protein [Methanomicrobiales archaeon]
MIILPVHAILRFGSAQMQNRFICDIGDFGKYGLLRMLTGASGKDNCITLSLGIVWYLASADKAAKDGKKTRYLYDVGHRLRSCDPELFDSLREIAICSERSIACIRDSRLFPEGTAYFEEILPVPENRKSGKHSSESREIWVQRALASTRGADIVYLDPDNGLMPLGMPLSRKESVKYASLEEIARFCARGSSAVLYHHLSRRVPAAVQIDALFRRLHEYRIEGVKTCLLRYHRGGARVFIILAMPRHRDILSRRARSMVERTPWGRHFTLVEDGQILCA